MKKMYYPLLIVTLVIAISGCSKKSDNPVAPLPPTEAQPSFSITAQPVTLATGDAGLQFIARCTTDDVDLVKVIVQNPRGQSQTFNAGNTEFVKDEEFYCEDQATGYFKYLGTWSLTFVGNKATGTKSSFNVISTLSVTGKISE